MICNVGILDYAQWEDKTMKQNLKREEIAAVFIEMLNDTPLESLRTEDLCAKAHVSKSTFYRLFRDKYELAFWIYQKHTDEVVQAHPNLECWDEWTRHNLEHMIQYKAFYRNIASYRGQNCLYDSLALYYRRNIMNFRKNKTEKLTDDQEYAVYMLSIINAQIMIDWILSGFDTPPEIVQHRAALCIPECIREFYE